MTDPSARQSGALLATPAWLTARIADSARRWPGADTRVATTLWWYTASSTLFRSLLGPWALNGSLRHPGLEFVGFTLGGHGVLAEVSSCWDCADLDELGAAWQATLTEILEPLSRAGNTRVRPLWAIAADSLANRALDAGTRGAQFAVDLAARIGPDLPTPRFVQAGTEQSRLFCRRNSCCLIYETERNGKCVSCPRQRPDERHALLARLADDSARGGHGG